MINTFFSKQKLKDWIQLLVNANSTISGFYENFAFIKSENKKTKLLEHLDQLTKVQFNLCTEIENISMSTMLEAAKENLIKM